MALDTCQQQWIDQFAAWAQARDDVRAALEVGSRGRQCSIEREIE